VPSVGANVCKVRLGSGKTFRPIIDCWVAKQAVDHPQADRIWHSNIGLIREDDNAERRNVGDRSIVKP
jgi:hypothetical protein